MSKRKFSEIWLHFEDDDGQKAKCKYCKTILSFSGGSHGNLRRHLKTKHPLTPLNFERQTPTPIEINVDEHSDEQPSTSTQVRAINQQHQITQFFNRPPPIRKQQHIDNLVLKMIAKGHHPFRLVEEPDFKKLIQEVSTCPGYTLPSRKTLSNSLLLSTHAKILEDVKIKVKSATAVCLTTDGWTSRANISYVAVTAHFINNDTQLTSYLLSCSEFKDRHTADNLNKFLKQVISDFEITNKVSAIVSDNAPNIVAAIRQGEWRGIGCFAHSLNLIVQTATAEIADTINKAKKIVEYFHKSSQASSKLLNAQKQMNLNI